MVEGYINDITPKSSYLEAPTVVKDNNETTNRNEKRDLNPTAVDESNNNRVKRANTVLKANNILSAYVLEGKEEWFYQSTGNYDVWNSDSYPPKKGMEMGGSHTFTGDTDVFNLTKTKQNGK